MFSLAGTEVQADPLDAFGGDLQLKGPQVEMEPLLIDAEAELGKGAVIPFFQGIIYNFAHRQRIQLRASIHDSDWVCHCFTTFSFEFVERGSLPATTSSMWGLRRRASAVRGRQKILPRFLYFIL